MSQSWRVVSNKNVRLRTLQSICPKQNLSFAGSVPFSISPNGRKAAEIISNWNWLLTYFENIDTVGGGNIIVFRAILSKSPSYGNHSRFWQTGCLGYEKRHSTDNMFQTGKNCSTASVYPSSHQVKSTLSFELKATEVTWLPGDICAVFEAPKFQTLSP